jgi:hypothetical protein
VVRPTLSVKNDPCSNQTDIEWMSRLRLIRLSCPPVRVQVVRMPPSDAHQLLMEGSPTGRLPTPARGSCIDAWKCLPQPLQWLLRQ